MLATHVALHLTLVSHSVGLWVVVSKFNFSSHMDLAKFPSSSIQSRISAYDEKEEFVISYLILFWLAMNQKIWATFFTPKPFSVISLEIFFSTLWALASDFIGCFSRRAAGRKGELH